MIIQNPEFILLLPILIYPILLTYKKKGYNRKIAASRTIIITLILIAAVSPAITQLENSSTKQKINILWDNTTSMKAVENPEISIKGTEKTFISGNNSNIFSQAGESIEPQSHNLLITDGRTEQQPKTLVKEAERLNTSVSIYQLKDKKEASVWIKGPSTTVPGAENEFTVRYSSTKDISKPVTVRLDGKEIFSGKINKSYSFEQKFDSENQHTIKAYINTSDSFQNNNKFYKTINLREKPEIMVLGDEGSLKTSLKEFYDVKVSQKLPEDMQDYYAVIAKKPVENPQIKSYLSQGNGLMYTGPLNNSIPDYLPQKKTEDPKENQSGAKILIAIDASEGTGGKCIEGTENFCIERSTTGGSAKESIKISYGLVESLKEKNRVGVTAYNRESYLVSETKSLAYNRKSIKESISRITPEGPSFHDRGLKGANQLVDSNDTVVMLSDGKIGDYENNRNVPSKLRSQAESMEAKLITVGMGDNPNKPLLKNIAERTDGGYYLENNEAGRLEFEFGAGGGESEYKPVAVTYPNHFITEGLRLDGSTTGFDDVKAKNSAQTIVSSSNGKNVLTTWRYGLGRIASFSAGDQNLERLISSDPNFISKTVSWVVGNPQRKKETWKNIEDARRPNHPVAKSSYQIDGLTQESENFYTTELSPESLGIHHWNDEAYAYNYNSEKQVLGQNMDKLSVVAQKTGGKIYDSENIDRLPQKLRETNEKVEKTTSLSPYLISLALIMFLTEVGFRKRKGRL